MGLSYCRWLLVYGGNLLPINRSLYFGERKKDVLKVNTGGVCITVDPHSYMLWCRECITHGRTCVYSLIIHFFLQFWVHFKTKFYTLTTVSNNLRLSFTQRSTVESSELKKIDLWELKIALNKLKLFQKFEHFYGAERKCRVRL